MRHLENLHIQSFRGLRDLKLEDFGQVNLLVGGNNSGKTSVLEAIDLHAHPLDILRFVTISKRRDSDAAKLPVVDSLKWLFPVKNEATEGQLETILVESTTLEETRKSIVSCKLSEMIEESEQGDKLRYQIEVFHERYDALVNRREECRFEVERLKNEVEVGKRFGQAKVTISFLTELLEQYQREFDQRQIEINRVEEMLDALKEEYSQLSADLAPVAELMMHSIEFWNSQRKVNRHNHDSFYITNRTAIKKGKNTLKPIPTEFVTPTDHRSMPINSKVITDTIFSDNDAKIIELLRMFEPFINSVKILAPDGRIPVPYLSHKKLGLTPSSVFGDGVRRALTLASAVVNAQNGLLLIDEIETAVYAKQLPKLFRWLVEACKQYNVQLFATTHSLEAIDAILTVIKGGEDDAPASDLLDSFVTYKLETEDDVTTATRFSGEEVYDIRHHFGLDVR
jgi:AAA15 family ATPase/GTPase